MAETKNTIDAREYMNLRKVLSDKDYYLDAGQNSAEIRDLVVLLKDSGSGILPGNMGIKEKEAAAISALYKENRKKAFQNLVEYAQNDKPLSKSTIDTLKVYADFCFYREHPELFEDLCVSVYNIAAPVKFGPIRMPGSTAFPRTYESTYRMLFFNYEKAQGKDGTKVEMFSPDVYPLLDDYMNKFNEWEPTSFYDAYAVFEYYKDLFILQQCRIGRRFTPHFETDSKRLDYYTSKFFDASKISAECSVGLDVGKQSEEPDLARDMSRYSYDRETTGRNMVRRAFFDAIAKAGELPQEVTDEDGRVYSLQQCLDIMGAKDFLNAADAAYFMHGNPKEYSAFLLLQKLYDASASQKQ